MLLMCNPVENFFQLVLEISLNLSPVAIHKGLGVSLAFEEECLKLVLSNQDRAVYNFFLLILLLAEADLVMKKRRSKKKQVKTLSSSGDKVIFTLLTEVVAFHIGFTVVHARETDFQELVLGLFRGGGGSNSKTVFRICCKFSLIYLGIVGTLAKTTAIEKFTLRGPVGQLDNSSSNLKGREELKRVTERCSLRERPQPQTEDILELISL